MAPRLKDQIMSRKKAEPESEYLHISERAMEGILMWLSGYSKSCMKSDPQSSRNLEACQCGSWPWLGPLCKFIIGGWGQRRPVIEVRADNKLREITNTRDDRIRIQKHLDKLKQWMESRRWHLIKINVIFCALGQKADGSRVRETQAWTAEWVKAWRHFTSSETNVSQQVDGVIAEVDMNLRDAFIQVSYPHPRRRHTISQAQLTDHTSRRRLTSRGRIKGRN